MREDPDMTEHGGYLVPRDPRVNRGAAPDLGLMRLDDVRDPPPASTP